MPQTNPLSIDNVGRFSREAFALIGDAGNRIKEKLCPRKARKARTNKTQENNLWKMIKKPEPDDFFRDFRVFRGQNEGHVISTSFMRLPWQVIEIGDRRQTSRFLRIDAALSDHKTVCSDATKYPRHPVRRPFNLRRGSVKTRLTLPCMSTVATLQSATESTVKPV